MRRLVIHGFDPRVVILILVLLAGGVSACSSPTTPSAPAQTPSAPLTPARNIAGTWSTDASATFIYQTDYCGARADVGRSLWNVTWTITPVSGFTNVVDVEMRFARGSMTPVGSCQPNGWVPLVSPTFFRLCVSSSSVTKCNGENYPNGYAFGAFTDFTMDLTWTHWDCVIYCSGEVTETNKLQLRKRT
jgi:hypothetical protein